MSEELEKQEVSAEDAGSTEAAPVEASPADTEMPAAETAEVAEALEASEAEAASSESLEEADEAEAFVLDNELPVEAADEGSAAASEAEAKGISLAAVMEAVLFTSQKPVGVGEFSQILKGAAAAKPEDPALGRLAKSKEPQMREAIAELVQSYADARRSFTVRESAAGWQLVTTPDFAPWLRQLFPENRPAKLSAPALETLAIIAYRQPLTRADIEAVRGVAVDGVMQTLLDRGLVKIAGRAEVPGRPLLYETTQHFLEHFGLRDLTELPNAGELRHIPLPKAQPPAEKPAESTVDAAETAADSNELPQELPFAEVEGKATEEADATDATDEAESTEIEIPQDSASIEADESAAAEKEEDEH
jgi:segregation and condensation protein B